MHPPSPLLVLSGAPVGQAAVPRPAPERAGRGRPLGARTQVLRLEHCLGRPHVAFLRACFQGLDPRVAWVRYLGRDAAGVDRRHIESQRRRMLAAVLRVAGAASAAQPPQWRVEEALQVLARARPETQAHALPSLSDWIDEHQIDTDMYGEAELLALYREHFGLDGPPEGAVLDAAPGGTSTGEQVRALNAVEPLLLEPPRAGDPVSLWLRPRLATGFQALGAESLGAAWAYIRQHGRSWFQDFWGVGAVQARQVESWLQSQARHWDAPGERTAPTVAGSLAAAAPWQRPGVSPAEAHRLVVWLDGQDLSPGTRAIYQRELERFGWWCRIERDMAPGDAGEAELRDYLAFLEAVPDRWVCRQPVAREHIDWRPFRGSLGPAARRLAGRLIARFLSVPYPGAGLPALRVPAPVWDGARVVGAAVALKDSPRARRLRAVLALWLEGRMSLQRLSELRVPLRGDVSIEWACEALGVPVSPHTWQFWLEHQQDALRRSTHAAAVQPLPGSPGEPPAVLPAIFGRPRGVRPSREVSQTDGGAEPGAFSIPSAAALGRIVSRFLHRLARQDHVTTRDRRFGAGLTAARWRSSLGQPG